MTKGTRKSAVVICPGRGTYNKGDLGILGRYFTDKALLAELDERRHHAGQSTLTELDSAPHYSIARHTRGDNASALIYAVTWADYCAIHGADIVAITGNSMGWYSALACGGALTPEAGFDVVNTMGTLMQQNLIGGQLIYPFMNDDWTVETERKFKLMALVDEIDVRPDHSLSLSINLGGMLVLAGNDAGLMAFEASVPSTQGRFPMRLANHAAFHSALQSPVSALGRERLPKEMFGQPDVALVDGRGQVWWPGATDTEDLWGYTLTHQVVETYDFTKAVITAAREFAPDLFIVTGPGTNLGGAVAQSLILAEWLGMTSKLDFKQQQDEDPVVLSMGLENQRASITKEG